MEVKYEALAYLILESLVLIAYAIPAIYVLI